MAPPVPVTLTVALKYRSAPEEYAKKAGVDVPTTVMASYQRVLFASEAERADAARELAAESTAKVAASPGDGMLIGIAAAGLLAVAALIAVPPVLGRRRG